MSRIVPDRLILQLPNDELEKFVREWAGYLNSYVAVQLFAGPGDLGRDVVGYHTDKRHEGEWDNFQCKQYGGTLPTATGVLDVGKVLYYAHRGEFTAPMKFTFVAPRGVNRTLRRLIANPSQFKTTLINDWKKYCEHGIVSGQQVALDPALRAFIENWDFSRIISLSVHDLLDDPASKPVMAKWFGQDPGPPPTGVVPTHIERQEMPYVQQLLDAYGERDGKIFASHADAKDHAEYGSHLAMQRERFFDADAFTRFYRDNTMSEEIEALRHDIRQGTAEVHRQNYQDALARVDAVMTQAANLQPSGVLSRYARVPVKQGICHHFANEGKLTWHRTRK
jgi:hypothetical protein